MADKLRRYFSFITVTPILVATLIGGLTLLVAVLIEINIGSIQQQAIDRKIQENQILIKSRLSGYAHVAQGGAAFASTNLVDRSSWGRFLQAFSVTENFPLITTVAMTRQIPSSDASALMERLTTEYGRPIAHTGAADRPDANILSYLYPETDETMAFVGSDTYSDPVFTGAMERATDSGLPVIVYRRAPMAGVPNPPDSITPSLLTYAAYYDPTLPQTTAEERRVAVRGHVITAYKPTQVMASIFGDNASPNVAINVYVDEVKADNLLYTSAAQAMTDVAGRRVQDVVVFGRKFIVTYAYDQNYLVPIGQRGIPLVATLFGLAMATIAGIVMFIFLRARQRGMQLDKERDITRAKDELLSIASHQMRTPATGVKQYLGMVLQGFAGDLTSSQTELLSKAYASNERQLRVVNDVLHLAKLDLGRVVLAKSTFDLTTMIRDIVEEQSQESRAAKITIQLRLLKKAPFYGDQHALRMVVENVVSNAIKYTNPGGRVSVRLRRHKGNYILTVADTGVGIAKEEMEKLFKQFSRITNERSHLVSGTGVGLYLAQHLTRLHGGDITVSSTLGKGSSFYITLPMKGKV